MRIIYRRPRWDEQHRREVLHYERWLWPRSFAWSHAEEHGGFRKAHSEWFWGYTYEPEEAARARERARYMTRDPRRGGMVL